MADKYPAVLAGPTVPHRAGPLAPERIGRVRARRLTAPVFVVAVLLVCLLLQRLSVPGGGSLKISLATPLVLGLSGWALASGLLVLDRLRTALFLGLCAVAMVSTAVQINAPLAIAPRASITSLLYWLAITALAVLRLREPIGETRFFRLVCLCLAGVAAAGVLQFALQFVGLRLFSFAGIVPDGLLMEDHFNVVIPLDYAGTFKSNGLFLVEPSVFSQLMAVGIIIEALYFRRPALLLLFFAGLLCSASGTGWLVLASYVIWIGLTSGMGGLFAAVVLSGAAIAVLAAASFVVPEVTGSLLGRFDELSLPGSSGYERFVTPFLAWRAVLAAAPWTFFTGIGPGASEQLTVPFFYVLNTPVKIASEYGIFGLLLYVMLLVSGRRTRRQSALQAPLIVLLLFTGGYHQFSPILFLVLLLGTVAALYEDMAPA